MKHLAIRAHALVLAFATFAIATAAQSAPIAVDGLPADAPLAITAARDGETLRVKVTLQPEWHLYGRDTGGGQPVAITIDRGAFTAAGPLVVPMGEDGQIRGVAELALPLRRTGAGDELHATMKFIVCDPLHCLPPMTLALHSADPLRVLLVAIDAGERTQRIAAFLQTRGFVTTTATWGEVTAEQCAAHDVVLADSPTFDQCKGVGTKVGKFPRTDTPIVAVGFLGTRLLEENKVAMACGYI
jgi:hypothetical protein